MILIAGIPADAQISKESKVNTNNSIRLATIAFESLLGISLVGGLIIAGIAMRNKALGRTEFSNYIPSLFVFFVGFLMTLFWGFFVGHFNFVLTALEICNAMFYVYVLIEALLNSSFD